MKKTLLILTLFVMGVFLCTQAACFAEEIPDEEVPELLTDDVPDEEVPELLSDDLPDEEVPELF